MNNFSPRMNALFNACEVRAKAIHGEEIVELALAEAMKFEIAEEFIRHPDPFDSLVRWYKDRDKVNALLPFAQKTEPNG